MSGHMRCLCLTSRVCVGARVSVYLCVRVCVQVSVCMCECKVWFVPCLILLGLWYWDCVVLSHSVRLGFEGECNLGQAVHALAALCAVMMARIMQCALSTLGFAASLVGGTLVAMRSPKVSPTHACLELLHCPSSVSICV